MNAFDTNCLMSADEVMANIFHLAQNMDKGLHGSDLIAPSRPTSPIFSFVAARRGPYKGRGHINRGGRGGRGMPNK
jgi:hypothetical protein